MRHVDNIKWTISFIRKKRNWFNFDVNFSSNYNCSVRLFVKRLYTGYLNDIFLLVFFCLGVFILFQGKLVCFYYLLSIRDVTVKFIIILWALECYPFHILYNLKSIIYERSRLHINLFSLNMILYAEATIIFLLKTSQLIWHRFCQWRT